MDSTSMTNVLIGASRIKYNVLNDLLPKGIFSKTVNMVIDGYSIFSRLYQVEYMSDIAHVDDAVIIQEFVSSALNTLAHYRRYLATRHGVKNRIFIVWNREFPDYQCKLVETYGEKYFERFFPDDMGFGPMNKTINKAIKFLKEMVQYFEDIYYLNTDGVDDQAVIYMLKEKLYPKDEFLLMSSNDIWLQFCYHGSALIRPARDNSKVIFSGPSNAVGKYYFKGTKYKPEYINADNIRHLMAIAGCKGRDIKAPGKYRSVAIAKLIDKMVRDETYIDDMNISLFLDAINSYFKQPYTDSELKECENNFKAISGKLSYKAMSDGQKKKIEQSIVNLYDAAGLAELNEQFTDVNDVINITDLNMNNGKSEDGFTAYEDETRAFLDALDDIWMER